MIRGLYVSAAGMLSHSLRHEINSVNLANLNTPGYKARRPALGEFGQLLLHRLDGSAVPVGVVGLGPAVAAVDNDVTQGALRETGRPLDLALEGPGFFVVLTPEGARYTRAGDFRRAADGTLVTAEGYIVLGEAGPLRVDDEPVTVEPDGTVYSGTRRAGRLQVITFPVPEKAQRDAAGTFIPTTESGPPVPAAGYRVRQGFLEEANVDAVRAAVEMIDAFRAYEASQRAIQVHSETLRLAATELARLS